MGNFPCFMEVLRSLEKRRPGYNLRNREPSKARVNKIRQEVLRIAFQGTTLDVARLRS